MGISITHLIKKSILLFLIVFSLLSCSEKNENNTTEYKLKKIKVSVLNITKTTATINWTKAQVPNNKKVFYNIQQGTNLIENVKNNTYTFLNLEEGKNYKGAVVAYLKTGEKTAVSFSFTTKTTAPSETVYNFKIPDKLVSYYKDINFEKYGNSLKEDLAVLTISKHVHFLSYFERHSYLYKADKDPKIKNNVLLIYSGESRYWKEYQSYSNSYSPQTFNTEHVFPKSKLEKEASKSDLHLLRVCDAKINTSRWNYAYANGSGTYGLVGSSNWYPGDEWKGDVARIIMYVNLRYNEPFSDVSAGGINLLLKWNAEDPVSTFETQRNEVIYKAQGNRNPFIDNPYLATKIWGGTTAKNTWK